MESIFIILNGQILIQIYEKTDFYRIFNTHILSPLTCFSLWLKKSVLFYKYGYSRVEISDNSNYHRRYYLLV